MLLFNNNNTIFQSNLNKCCYSFSPSHFSILISSCLWDNQPTNDSDIFADGQFSIHHNDSRIQMEQTTQWRRISLTTSQLALEIGSSSSSQARWEEGGQDQPDKLIGSILLIIIFK